MTEFEKTIRPAVKADFAKGNLLFTKSEQDEWLTVRVAEIMLYGLVRMALVAGTSTITDDVCPDVNSPVECALYFVNRGLKEGC